jgi:hypothetical protein
LLRLSFVLTRADLGLYGNEVTPDTFPLPTLGPKLQQVALDIHRGRGFAVVRGMNPDEFSPEDNVLVFLGISSYIGVQRGRQDEEGNMLSKSPGPLLKATLLTNHPSAHPRREALQDTTARPPNPVLLPGFSTPPLPN